jgi:hypothetical protein
MNVGILLSLCGLLSLGTNSTPVLHGDYVEARTASVYAGACHYNSEYMTCGRDAILAFDISTGSVNGVRMDGVRAMAVVTADDNNLADAGMVHESDLLIDNSASDAQSRALVAAIKSQWGLSLGDIKVIRRGEISFTHDKNGYAVSAAGFGAIKVQAMPNDDCCKQPDQVWYTPLISLTSRKVGYTQDAKYTAATISDRWERAAENGAFYGSF